MPVPTVPVVARVYDRLVASCTTINQVNRVNIAFERRLTPSEVAILSHHLRLDDGATFGLGFGVIVRARKELEENLRRRLGRLRAKFRNVAFLQRRRSLTNLQDRFSSSLTPLERRRHSAWWAQAQERQLTAGGSVDSSPAVRPTMGQEFHRVWRRAGVALYSLQGPAAAEARSLIICFTGTTRRMGMPVSLWLHNLPSQRNDVLVLECPPSEFFVKGVRGFSDSLPATMEALAEFVRHHSYADVRVVASSGGTIPALFVGLRLGVNGILLAGPVAPTGDLWREFLPEGDLFPRIVEALRAAPSDGIPTWLAYGADDKADVLFATNLAAIVPGARLIPVPNSGHNCFYELSQRGELSDLLRKFLSAPLSGS
jgi:hypothetical protein